jgi:hypothetical protein
VDVAEQTSVAIGVVEVRVSLDLDPASGPCETLELAEGLACVALACAELRRVDLHESDAVAAPEVERVAVADARNGRALTHALFAGLRAADQCAREREDDGKRAQGL